MTRADNYCPSVEELAVVATLHWPQEIIDVATGQSVLPLLLQTQDTFISILKVANHSPDSWVRALSENNQLTGALFIKHLMVLADLGGELLNKITPITRYFPNSGFTLNWNGTSQFITFSILHTMRSLTNSSLKVQARDLINSGALTPVQRDVGMLILFGALAVDSELPSEFVDRCSLGSLLGDPKAIDAFVDQRYLHVSRIVGGGSANAMGQAVQRWVLNELKTNLPTSWRVEINQPLSGVRHSANGNLTNFDLVVKSPLGSEFGIEVSFQVTTNSTIERKAREAAGLYAAVHAQGHKICYVIDGAGNINVRREAVRRICQNSDCTVALSKTEIKKLTNFLLNHDKN